MCNLNNAESFLQPSPLTDSASDLDKVLDATILAMASLAEPGEAGNHIARIDTETGAATVIEPPTKDQGARRVWSDSHGRIWVSEWLSGNLSQHDPAKGSWRKWRVPGDNPRPYAVWVDARDKVWVSDWGSNAMFRFDPEAERFERFAFARANANVRQIHGRAGEVWLPESGTEHISVIRTAT